MKNKQHTYITLLISLMLVFPSKAFAMMITKSLATAMYDAAPEFWVIVIIISAIITTSLLYFLVQYFILRRKIYFINRDRNRYAETIFASKDGYFAWLYPDTTVNDKRKTPKEICSRRLSIILGLEKGRNSNFEEILDVLETKENRSEVRRLSENLRLEGLPFEKVIHLASKNKFIKIFGAKISDNDGSVYADMIWFRDITSTQEEIIKLTNSMNSANNKAKLLDNLINHLPIPVWLRNDKLAIELCNNKFIETVEADSKEEVLIKRIELLGADSKEIKMQSSFARASGHAKKGVGSAVIGGQRKIFEYTETPFTNSINEGEPNINDAVYTAGCALDISNLDESNRSIRQHQEAHTKLLASLGSAVAVFGSNKELSYYNDALLEFFLFDKEYLDSKPKYQQFLDILREKRLLPEVPDYQKYKNQEIDAFSAIIEAKEDILYLPNDKTVRRIRAPHPLGGLIFTYEDVSDRLSIERSYATLMEVQKQTLDGIKEAVSVFSPNGRLSITNQAYIDLWKLNKAFIDSSPYISDLLEKYHSYFDTVQDWEGLKKELIGHITNRNTKTIRLHRNDGIVIDITSSYLSDNSIMVNYVNVTHETRIEKSLSRSKDNISTTSYLRSEFIKNVSEEIKPSLKTISGFSSKILDSKENQMLPETKEYIKDVQSVVKNLDLMMQDVFDIAPFDIRSDEPEYKELDITAIINNIIGFNTQKAKQKKIKISFSVKDKINPIIADEKYLKQIIFYMICSALDNCADSKKINTELRLNGDNIEFSIFGILKDKNALKSKSQESGLKLIQRFASMQGGKLENSIDDGHNYYIYLSIPLKNTI